MTSMSIYINNTVENNLGHSSLQVAMYSMVSILRKMISEVIVSDFPEISDHYRKSYE